MRRLPLVRVGECSLCGDCCAGDPFSGARGEPIFPGMCPALVPGEGDTRVCSLHGSDDLYWRQACSQWPSKPEHVVQPHIRECSFRFEAR